MQEQNDEEIISKTQEGDVDSTTTQQEDKEAEEKSDDLEDIKLRLQKAEELANNYKIRAEKAEKRAKTSDGASRSDFEMSPVDIIALSKANMEPEDVSEVMEYAKFKNISIQEALKSPIVRATLANNAEMRNTAQAANTGASKRQTGRISTDALLANARKGIMPDSEEDMARLLAARRANLN